MYQTIPGSDAIRRVADGAVIPNSPIADWRDYQAWRDAGNEPQPPSPLTVNQLRAYAAEKRWKIEIGGVPFGGLRLPSDDRAKTLIMGAAGAMSDTATAPFVVGSSVVTFTGAQFKAAHQAIVAHVQACFATQVAVLAAIDAGTIATTAQIDAAAWPANS